MHETEEVADKNNEAYREKQKAELKELAARLQLLEAKKDKVGADLKMSYNQELRTLREKQKNASEKLERLMEETGEAWNDVREGADEALADLKASLDNAADRFK